MYKMEITQFNLLKKVLENMSKYSDEITIEQIAEMRADFFPDTEIRFGSESRNHRGEVSRAIKNPKKINTIEFVSPFGVIMTFRVKLLDENKGLFRLVDYKLNESIIDVD